MKTAIVYAHRHNRDGSIDSICLGCFLTIATANTMEELSPYEIAHVCADDHFEEQQKKWKQGIESPLDVRA